ncbi:hypothetical protein CA424_005186 [Salmonella enterica subsp. enterica]|nr:hypothetical protein [Salmonella enterica subsp. enterica]
MSDIKPAIKAYSELQQAYDWFIFHTFILLAWFFARLDIEPRVQIDEDSLRHNQRY